MSVIGALLLQSAGICRPIWLSDAIPLGLFAMKARAIYPSAQLCSVVFLTFSWLYCITC